MIGILIVGLHQGQRTYAPHRQAGHMTAADQIVRSAKIVLAREGRPHMGRGMGVVWLKNWLSRRYGEETGGQILISLLIPFAAYLAA